jgi:hypothetical protein
VYQEASERIEEDESPSKKVKREEYDDGLGEAVEGV